MAMNCAIIRFDGFDGKETSGIIQFGGRRMRYHPPIELTQAEWYSRALAACRETARNRRNRLRRENYAAMKDLGLRRTADGWE